MMALLPSVPVDVGARVTTPDVVHRESTRGTLGFQLSLELELADRRCCNIINAGF